MQLSLADLIAYEVPLTPREAAALTLAVAEQWDSWSIHHRRVRSLPSKNAILLHQSGTVSFVAAAPADEGDFGEALSALLSSLLGLDVDPDADQQPFAYPAGLRRTVAQVGGSAGADAFRTALRRFASADPVVLRSVFWRAVRVIQTARTPAVALSFDERRRARPRTERRKRGMAASDLRREIRLLEREMYESRMPRVRTATARIARPKLAIAIAAACSLVVVTLSLARTVFAPDAQQDSATADRADTALPMHAALAAVTPAVAVSATPVVSLSPAVHHTLHATRTAAKSRVPGRHVAASPSPTPVRRPASTAAFAGGTRGFAWAVHAP